MTLETLVATRLGILQHSLVFSYNVNLNSISSPFFLKGKTEIGKNFKSFGKESLFAWKYLPKGHCHQPTCTLGPPVPHTVLQGSQEGRSLKLEMAMCSSVDDRALWASHTSWLSGAFTGKPCPGGLTKAALYQSLGHWFSQ